MRVFDVITVPCYMELSLRHSELAPRSAYVTKNSYITQWTEKYGLGVPALKSSAVGLPPSSLHSSYLCACGLSSPHPEREAFHSSEYSRMSQ